MMAHISKCLLCARYSIQVHYLIFIKIIQVTIVLHVNSQRRKPKVREGFASGLTGVHVLAALTVEFVAVTQIPSGLVSTSDIHQVKSVAWR